MKSFVNKNVLAAFIVALQWQSAESFAPGYGSPSLLQKSVERSWQLGSTLQDKIEEPTDQKPASRQPVAVEEESSVVRAPLKYLGPYPCMGLRFPDLATPGQQKRGEKGISLDFVLDTAANTNTINGQVAEELELDVVGAALPGVGTSGAISGGDTYLLGDCQLDGIAKEDQFTFMTGLTASALPVASPVSAGLLSLAFLQCFEGGVEFDWGQVGDDGKIKTIPSVTFYGRKEDVDKEVIRERSRVPIEPLPVTLLPSVTIRINGVEMPALLDTGSPITVLNAEAARTAGVKTVQGMEEMTKSQQSSKNPFAAIANNFKAANAAAKAAARGDVLAIAGADGKRVELLKSTEKVDVALAASDGADKNAEFGLSNVYVGDLPGLAAMNGLGVEAPPAVVLGMDVLRLKPKMLLRAQTNELYI